MKKLYLIGILAIISSLILLTIAKGNLQSKKRIALPVSTPSPFVMPENTVEITFDGKSYWVSWIKVDDLSKLTLFPNFQEKTTARSFINKNKCQYLVNGGFYTEDDRPLGLFESGGEKIREKSANFLIPEIFFVTSDGEFDMVAEPPLRKVRFALQTGPLLIEKGLPKKLAIKNDETSRRMVVGKTSQREVIFLAVYDKEETFQGPPLSDLPGIINEFQKQKGIFFTKAVNLDGGSASVFYTNSLFLEELTYAGSFFCVTD